MESNASLRSTPVRRGWGATLLMAGGGLVCGVGAVAVWSSGTGWLAVVLGIVAVICVLVALFGSGSAPCPTCGAPLTQLMATALERCHRCGRYAEVRQKRLWEVDPDRVLLLPGFSIPLPDRYAMPELCCSCGLPATRWEDVSIDLAEVASPLSVTGNIVRSSVSVPECGQHSGGAKLDREVLKKPLNAQLGDEAGALPVTVLKVRSYRFYLEFLRLNPSCAGSGEAVETTKPAGF